MPMNRSLYPANWPKVSRTIRRIAGNRCEWCGCASGTPLPGGYKVVLGVAHLGSPYPDGRPGDKEDKHDLRRENLALLCARCHFGYDRPEILATQKRNRQAQRRLVARQAGQLKLIVEAIG